jgi:hypothetical protein
LIALLFDWLFRKRGPGMHHVAFEVATIDDVMRSMGRLRRHGHDAGDRSR